MAAVALISCGKVCPGHYRLWTSQAQSKHTEVQDPATKNKGNRKSAVNDARIASKT
jgi:hypothetical protein